MKHLSEGLQATAGNRLRRFMSGATKHRIYGIGTGIVSTIIVQSSSIITVMLVGFVSTAIMTLPQAFSVLIGANIGTTATVWIIAFAPNPQMVGLAGLALGGIIYFFFRGERIHNLGLTVIGLGLVFFGLYFMSKGVSPIRSNPEIAKIFALKGIRIILTVTGNEYLFSLLSHCRINAAFLGRCEYFDLADSLNVLSLYRGMS
jgi:phosphate:Na+ symporter